MKIINNILLVIGVFILSSCEKEWKKPTDVTFSGQLNDTGNSLIKFTSAHLTINTLSFNGERKEGQTSVALQQAFANSYTLNFYPAAQALGIKFNVPQGTYTKIELDLSSIQVVDSLLICGYYLKEDSKDTAHIKLKFSGNNVVKILAKLSNGNSEISLVEGHPLNANIIINPGYWVAPVTKDMLEGADGEGDDDHDKTVEISEKKNTAIYNLMKIGIGDGYQAVF